MKRTAVLTVVLAIVTAIVAFIGVFARGGETTELVTSVRGEIYPMVTHGIYAFNAERIVAEGVGWDFFTLFFVVPALLALALPLARGSLRARLIALGLFAYLFYQYFMYALCWAFGPLFLPFVAIAVLALAGILSIATKLEAIDFDDRFPRRSVAVLAGVLAAVLVMMWLARIAKGELLGQTTMVVQALDLTLVVPLATITAGAAWRRRRAGFVLASVFVVKATAMATAICAMLVQAWRVQGKPDVAALAFFGAAAAYLRSTRSG